MLVHGEGEKMKFLRSKIRAEHGIDCYMPANGETAAIPGRTTVPARVSVSLLKKEAALYARQPPDAKRVRLLHGVMVLRADGSFTLEEPEAAAAQLGVTPHTVRFTTKVSRLGLLGCTTLGPGEPGGLRGGGGRGGAGGGGGQGRAGGGAGRPHQGRRGGHQGGERHRAGGQGGVWNG